MDEYAQDALLAAADEALPADEAELLRALHAFTAERLAAAQSCRERLTQAAEDGAELHAFLRECWEALDGLAREVNLVMHALYPGAGLDPPFEMSRQCTFYVVRKLLHESPETTARPVAELLWQETREDGHRAYRRLSFFHNLSHFLSIAPADGRLPGVGQVPPLAGSLIRPQQVEACGLEEGLEEMLGWLGDFIRRCYARLRVAATEGKT